MVDHPHQSRRMNQTKLQLVHLKIAIRHQNQSKDNQFLFLCFNIPTMDREYIHS